MFTVRTRVGASAIHGTGVFAAEPIAAGQEVWRYEPAFDRTITDAELAGVPDAFRRFLETYAYRSADLGGALVLPCDHAIFLNHSDVPNTAEEPFRSVASRSIPAGEEITCDYGAFCVGWTGFDT